MAGLSLYIKVNKKYPTTTGEYEISTGIATYDINCVNPGNAFDYIRVSDKSFNTELYFNSNCTSRLIVVIWTDSKIINSHLIDSDDNTFLIKSNQTSDNQYRFWFNATYNEEDTQLHSVKIFTKTENLFSNRYRVHLSNGNLSEVSFYYNEWDYFCESDCFLVFSSIKSNKPMGRDDSEKFKMFEPDENTLLVGFYPSKTLWFLGEFICFSVTAGLVLKLVPGVSYSRKKQKPETFK